MTTATAVPAMTNQQLGELIGCTHSMASRIRRGKRLPGDETMVRVHEALGWELDSQVRAKLRGSDFYGTELRRRLSGFQRDQAA